MEINSNETKDEIKTEDIDEDMDQKKGSKKAVKKCTKIHIDMNAIPSLEVEEDSELRHLGITAFDQTVYEENVFLQVDRALDQRQTHIPSHSSGAQRLQQVLDIHSNDSNCLPLLAVKTESFDTFEDLSENRSNETNDSYFKSESVDQISDNESKDEEEDEDSVEWKPSAEECQSDEEVDEVMAEYYSEDEDIDLNNDKTRKSKSKVPKPRKPLVRHRVIDDGNDKCFKARINEYKRQKLIEKHDNIRSDGTEVKDLDEMFKLENGFQIPKRIWEQLFPYQQTGVQWLWELHRLGCGGIVGDEMGLGKTIQVIAFLCGLSCSRFHDFRDLRKTLGPVLLVCPATVMHQWVAEFHKWWPYFRVSILHQSGSHCGKKENLIKVINKSNGILITSYSGVCGHQKHLLRHDWHYVILDEGHKIRNPDAQVTHACKMFSTPHRLILSGSPIQNNLRELWSLFDFIYPGKLGTLPVFMEHFAVPITQGGYSNATQIQIQIAYKMATILRDSIKPYLLRRMKDEVKSSLTLPSKNEQVLFCRLTDEQRDIYKSYLQCSEVKDMMRGSTQIFVGLINLRKICNHPKLFHKSADTISSTDDVMYYKRSGKMVVVDSLLRIWHKQSHKVLVFTQSRQMIKILENFMKYREYSHLVMDGTTSVQTRQPLIKRFNEDPNIFVFLLTTRVGGIGVNLTGANRVLIYDPDWNPSTDVQARERCWRIGQNKSVTIYRLLSSGTVEEKIYQRQIFKQYLTNRVLKDPKQRRFFKTNDLHELFTLGSDSNTTESSAIFAGTDSEVKVNPKAKRVKTDSNSSKSVLSAEKVEELRERAKMLSKMIAQKFANQDLNVLEEERVENQSNSYKESNDLTESALNPKTVSKSKPKKGTKFEGKRIKYLVKQDVYKEKALETESKAEDEYVLKKLFKRSKVQSALQHDVLECDSTPDFALAEKEAEIVANQAINALKRSRELCLNGRTSNPLTALKSVPKFGQKRKLSSETQTDCTSSSLISEIKIRNKFQTKGNCEDRSEMNAIPLNTEYDQLLADIRSFIAFQCRSSAGNKGETTTEELLEAFKDKLPTHQSAIFKSMLYQLCHFHRRADKVGVWRLKDEFR